MDRELDLEIQYDRIYRYCYFRLQNRETAEDITQETFLRFLQNKNYRNSGRNLQYLYTIARNLCIDEWRSRERRNLPLSHLEGEKGSAGEENLAEEDWKYAGEDSMEERVVTALTIREALEELEPETREMLLLRYVNEVPVGVVGKIFKISRFSVLRRMKAACAFLQDRLGKEDFHER